MTLPVVSLLVVIGTLPLLFLSVLPPWWLALLIVALVLPFAMSQRRILHYLAVGLLCFAWALLAAVQAIWPLAHISSQPQQLEVRISQTDGIHHHLAQITRLNGTLLWSPIPLALTSRRLEQPICAGQRWQMQVKIRAEHSSLNEGSYDPQRYALSQHRLLNGRVITASPLTSRCQLRAAYIHTIQPQLADYRWRDVIMALAVGERAALSMQTKNLLRDTATAHLLAISGLHIGFAALLGSWLARLIQGLLPTRYIGYRLPIFVALLFALLYTWISGANPPAQRSLVALLCWSLLRLSGRRWHPWQTWLCCLAAVLFIDPLSILSDSFWLSAFAVAGLIFWFQWLPFPASRLAVYWRYPLSLLHLQVGITLLLLPLQVLVFHGVSVTSILANLLAVPLVTLVSLPLIFFAMLVSLLHPSLARPFWWAADYSLQQLFRLLNALPAGWLPLDQRFLWLTALPWLAVLLYCWRGHLLPASSALAAMGLLFFPFWRKPAAESWAIHMLDLGASQAIVIERQGKAILYDAGNDWPGGNSAQQTIIPWLQWHHLTPQALIISDDAFDKHATQRRLQQQWRSLVVISPQPERSAASHRQTAQASDQKNGLPATLCQRGWRWQWQGLQLQAHWPLANSAPAQRSCVVSVSDGQNNILLTGNLDAGIERDLLRYHWQNIQAQVLIVPGQAHPKASSDLFLRRINGQLALASLPRYGVQQTRLNSVKQRYQQHGYHWYDTAHAGQITLRFSASGVHLHTLRQQLAPRWYHRWFQLADEPAISPVTDQR